MRLPVGFKERDVSEADIREVQHALWQHCMPGVTSPPRLAAEHQELIDACLSWMAKHVDRPALPRSDARPVLITPLAVLYEDARIEWR